MKIQLKLRQNAKSFFCLFFAGSQETFFKILTQHLWGLTRGFYYILGNCTYTWPLLPDWTCWTHWSSVALGGKKARKKERERDH